MYVCMYIYIYIGLTRMIDICLSINQSIFAPVGRGPSRDRYIHAYTHIPTPRSINQSINQSIYAPAGRGPSRNIYTYIHIYTHTTIYL